MFEVLFSLQTEFKKYTFHIERALFDQCELDVTEACVYDGGGVGLPSEDGADCDNTLDSGEDGDDDGRYDRDNGGDTSFGSGEDVGEWSFGCNDGDVWLQYGDFGDSVGAAGDDTTESDTNKDLRMCKRGGVIGDLDDDDGTGDGDDSLLRLCGGDGDDAGDDKGAVITVRVHFFPCMSTPIHIPSVFDARWVGEIRMFLLLWVGVPLVVSVPIVTAEGRLYVPVV